MRIRHTSLFLTALLFVLPATAKVSAQESSRMHNYVVSLVGPGALISIGASAAYDQVRNDPEVWEKTTEGFGKRVASAAGSRLANQTVRHGLAAVMDRSTGYTRCTCSAFGARLGHAIISAITDTNASGHRMLSVPAIAGAAAGAYAPLAWRPEYTSSRAFAGVGMSLGLSALGNVGHEFIY
jgi:hypothetical protein